MTDKAEIKARLEKDAEYFKEMLERMDSEGCFDDRFPNYGEQYGLDEMVDDVIVFENFISKPENLSFWR